MKDLPVTVEIIRKVRPEYLEDFEDELQKLIRFAITAPGHLGANVIRPTDGSTEYRVFVKFASERQFRRFQQSDRLRKWYLRIRPMLLEDPTIRISEGLEAWFTLPERPRQEPPEDWKMALVTWAAVYAFVMFYTWFLHGVGIFLPLWLEIALVAALTVATLQWLIMPWSTRLLAGWLTPRDKRGWRGPGG